MSDAVLDYSQTACLSSSDFNKEKSERNSSTGVDGRAMWTPNQISLLHKLEESGLNNVEIIKYLCAKEIPSRKLLEEVLKLFFKSRDNNHSATESDSDTNEKQLFQIRSSSQLKPTQTSSSTQTETLSFPEEKSRLVAEEA